MNFPWSSMNYVKCFYAFQWFVNFFKFMSNEIRLLKLDPSIQRFIIFFKIPRRNPCMYSMVQLTWNSFQGRCFKIDLPWNPPTVQPVLHFLRLIRLYALLVLFHGKGSYENGLFYFLLQLRFLHRRFMHINNSVA